MSFKPRLKKKIPSRNSFYLKELLGEHENFLLEASKIPVSIDFRASNLNATKNLIKSENHNEKINKIQSNISNLKLYSDNFKNLKRFTNLSKNIENTILPSILPEFKIKNQKGLKKNYKNKNQSIHFSSKKEKLESLAILNKNCFDEKRSLSPKHEEDIYDFLNNNNQILVKNEEKVGNLVRYSTIFERNKNKKFKKFYLD